MPITLEEAVEIAHEARGEWIVAMMNWAVKRYEYKAKQVEELKAQNVELINKLGRLARLSVPMK